MRHRARRGRWATVGFVGGIVVGLVLWSLQMKRSRRDLFSRNPIKRLAAMGYLGGEPSAENVQLLSDYCRWEPNPMLQKRANRLITRMKARLV
jgi:hypothetical protein